MFWGTATSMALMLGVISQKELGFIPINKTLQDVLPVFGAHPLSNIFNQGPIMLVEGEDDERIWQTAIRSSNGKINTWPCETGTNIVDP
jgi:hypothetical protein